nr:nodal modulator 1 [Tanacetum cinerariifolium]
DVVNKDNHEFIQRSSGRLLHQPLVDDNPTSGQSSNKHLTLEVGRTNHQSLEADNGSSPLAYSILVDPTILSYRTVLTDKVPVLQVQHQILDRFEISLGGLVRYPESPREILQESLELLDSEVMKGLSECKASESNVRRIQVKDIVKEVEDHLKTYLSAGWISAGPSDTRDTKIATLRLKFNAFKALEGETVNVLKPHHISATSFQTPSAFKVSLTSYMLKVAKLSKELKQSLLPPSGEVNANDTANKSLSMTCVQPVTQPKAPTAKNPRKKKIISSTQPKVSNDSREMNPSLTTTYLQATKEFVVTVIPLQSLEASISAEVQDNQPKVIDAIEVPEKTIELKEKVKEQSLKFPSIEQLLDEVDNHNKAVQESSENDNASAERMTLPNHMDHICKEVSFLHLKLSDIEYSIAEINSSLPTLITNALKEQLLDLLSVILKDCLPSIIKDSLQTHIPTVFEKFIETQTQLNKKLIKQLNRKLNVAHVAQSNRFVILQKELSKVIRSEDVKGLLESAVIIDETAEGEKKKKDENAIPASNQGEHQTAENITTPEPTPETQGELAFKESAMVLYDFKELLVDLAADSKLSLSSPKEPTPPIDESKWKGIATEEPPTDELVSFQAKRLGLPPSPKLVNFGLTAEEKKIKRAEFVKEVFITEDVRVDGMGRNLIPPPRVIPIQGLVISEPESGIFFMNRNTNIGKDKSTKLTASVVWTLPFCSSAYFIKLVISESKVVSPSILTDLLVLPNMALVLDIKAMSYDVCGSMQTVDLYKAKVPLRLSVIAISYLLFSPPHIDVNVNGPLMSAKFYQ